MHTYVPIDAGLMKGVCDKGREKEMFAGDGGNMMEGRQYMAPPSPPLRCLRAALSERRVVVTRQKLWVQDGGEGECVDVGDSEEF